MTIQYDYDQGDTLEPKDISHRQSQVGFRLAHLV
jgi:hypothetical protein